jgi:hypothetical protein
MGTVTTVKREPIEQEKIFARYSSDKILITRMCRELKKPNFQRINNILKKWAHELNKFSKEEVQMTKKYNYSTSLTIREMQIKTTVRFHLIPICMAIFKNTNNKKCWRRCSKTRTLIHLWWECKV